MRTFISIAGLAMVAGDDPNCVWEDYGYGFSELAFYEVAECLSANSTADNWDSCLNDQPVSETCGVYWSGLVADAASVCSTPCASINSTDCRTCNGVVALQQIAELVPNTSYAMCGSDYDRAQMIDASWSDVAAAENMTEWFLSVANFSDTCNYCLAEDIAWILEGENCGGLCTDNTTSPDCLNCVTAYMVDNLAWCSVYTWGEGCELTEMESLEMMDPAAVKTCMEGVVKGDGLVHCLTDVNSVNISLNCATSIVGDIDYEIYDFCDAHCTDNTSVECYNCKGSIMAQKTFGYESPDVNGSCGSEEDLNLLYDALTSNDTIREEVFTCGASAPYLGAMCLGIVAQVSTECNSCLTARSLHARQQCSDHCSDATSVDCLECVNIGLMAAAAYCNVNAMATCTTNDYKELSQINAGELATCMEDNEGDLQLCLSEVDHANMTDGCSGPMQSQIDDAMATCSDDPVCASDIPTAYCLNCRGAVMVQKIFANAPEESGVCGTSDNRELIASVAMEAVIACGSEQAYTGATCLAFQAGASPLCRDCLEEGTVRAIGQCKAHCLVNETGPDCINCVNLGLMSAAAYCSMSGSAGMAGSLSLISLAALLALALLH